MQLLKPTIIVFSYKQMQINVRNATWDLMYYKSPYDTNLTDGAITSWSAGIMKAVYADGTINKPGDVGMTPRTVKPV